MPGSTANLALPYPLPGEPLATIDERVQELATALDTYLRPRTVSGIVAGEVTSVANVFAYRCGPIGLVSVNVTTDATGIAAGGILFTLPAGFRPPVDLWQNTIVRAITPPEQAWRVTISTGGQVQTGAATGANEILRGLLTFPVAGA